METARIKIEGEPGKPGILLLDEIEKAPAPRLLSQDVGTN
jgi:hypothetical protein